MQFTHSRHAGATHFRAFVIALTARDCYTGSHCDRTRGLGDELGRCCGLGARDLRLLRSAAILHDIGKVAIPDRVLLKPGRLEPDERLLMQAHAATGADLLLALRLAEAQEVAHIVRHHHEGFDGLGYPDGLAGEAIPIVSRIISVCDSYDAMITARPYHPARGHDEVMRILGEETGAKLDPYVAGKFGKVIEHSAYRAPR